MADTPFAVSDPHADYLYSQALQACIYCWPLFEMQRMRSATSARKAPGQGFAGDSPESTQRWCNLFTHERELLTAGKSRVVMPNNDTLYANAWLDLSAGPLVITLPDSGSRYYVLGFLDYYTNPFAHVGTRTTGNQAGEVLVTGPGWSGAVPPAFQAPLRHVQAPTDWVWIIGRILVDGAQDVTAVNALQDRLRMDTLDDWQAGRNSPARRFDARHTPRAPFSVDRFVGMVNDALRICPPPANCHRSGPSGRSRCTAVQTISWCPTRSSVLPSETGRRAWCSTPTAASRSACSMRPRWMPAHAPTGCRRRRTRSSCACGPTCRTHH